LLNESAIPEKTLIYFLTSAEEAMGQHRFSDF